MSENDGADIWKQVQARKNDLSSWNSKNEKSDTGHMYTRVAVNEFQKKNTRRF